MRAADATQPAPQICSQSSSIPHPSSFIIPKRPIAQPILAETRRPARLPGPRRAGLPHAGPARRHPERRRVAAGAAGGRAGLRPGRRLLRARRAFHRAAPPRQRTADRRPRPTAIPRQHRPGGRARRDDHAPCRLAGGPGAWRGAARRPRRGPRAAAQTSPPIPQSLTGRYLAGVERIPLPQRRRRVAKTRSISIEGATDEQPQGRERVVPAGRAGVRHRRERVGQELAAG